jgi:FMN phosphatase YigB (HAD superfamily)
MLASRALHSSAPLETPGVDTSAQSLAAYAASDDTVCNPLIPTRRVRAVLFDVDGTLYRQRPLRLLMAVELGVLALTHPWRAPSVWRTLSAYRKAQESLRGGESADAARQLEVAASRARISTGEAAAIVDEWMIERPLKYLARCRARGLVDLLEFLAARRVQMGIFSDYPAEKKLDALGVRHYFSVVLCGGDPEVGAFKPSPRGFLAACARWQLDPGDVLYVGDRMDADAAGAAAAKMPAVIVASGQVRTTAGTRSVSSLERLRHVLDDNHRR